MRKTGIKHGPVLHSTYIVCYNQNYIFLKGEKFQKKTVEFSQNNVYSLKFGCILKKLVLIVKFPSNLHTHTVKNGAQIVKRENNKKKKKQKKSK